jgi:hypothetical protein
LRLLLVTIFLLAFDSQACTNEISPEFKPFAVATGERLGLKTYRLFFPVDDKSDEAMFLDGLTLSIPNRVAVELRTLLSEEVKGYYLAEVSLEESLTDDVMLIGSYNYNDIDGNGLSFCANWKQITLKQLLEAR